MKTFLSAILIVTLLSAGSFAADPVVSQEKKNNIIQLLEMTGTLKIAAQFADVSSVQIFDALMEAKPDIPKEVSGIIKSEMKAVIYEQINNGGFMERFIPVYDKYYTDEEIKDLIAFYQTNLGKKLIRVLPDITSESMVVGQKWGEAVAPIAIRRIQKRLQEEGIEI